MENWKAIEIVYLISSGIALAIAIVISTIVIIYRSQQKLLLAREKLHREKEENQRALLQSTLRGQESERKRIAQEIHDELGQVATVLRISLALAAEKLTRSTAFDKAEVANDLQEMIKLTDESIASVRRIIHDLQPISLHEIGVPSEIEEYLRKIEQRTEMPIAFTSNTTDLHLPEEVAVEIYRILQEAITNVLRHSKATQVEVGLYKREHEVDLVIKDNGVGLNQSRQDGKKTFGLQGIYERSRMIGAELLIKTQPGNGTQITLRIPMHALPYSPV